MVLKHIHDTNMRARGEPERVFTVSTPPPLLLIIIPPPSHSSDGAVSPPAGEQDQGAQAAGRAGGDAQRVGQRGAQGPPEDPDRAPSGAPLACFQPARVSFIPVFLLRIFRLKVKVFSPFDHRSGRRS